ncbi:ABC transporter substrate-binding protein [Plantibacter sp. Mn2098]|uniref:ABC transporter substrate-binding protein n=1 Tax=Plantibacter sp. Mn2098 TaxID=3395266 RepID=UPI003BDCF37E
MKRSSILPAVVGVGMTAVLLAGCSGASEQMAGPVKLDFWYSVTGVPADTLVALVDEFNASHDDVTVNPIFQGLYEESMAKLANAVQGGELPAIIQGGDTFSTYLRDSGLTVPPGEVKNLDGKTFDDSDLVPANANYYTFDGELSSIPIMVSHPVVFYNTALLEAAGIDPSTAPSTLGQLFDVAAAVHGASGAPGLTAHIQPWWAEQFAASAGVEYCTPGNGVGSEPATGFSYTSDAQVAAWQRVQGLVASGAMLNVGTDGDAALKAFVTGQAAIVLQSSRAYGDIVKAGAFEFGAWPLPIDDADGGAVPGGNSVWLVKEGNSEQELAAAASFAEFLASPDVQRRIFEETGYLPSSLEALDALSGAVEPVQDVILQQLAGAGDSVASAGCHSGALGEARPLVTSAIEEIYAGSDVLEALTKAQLAGDKAITEYNARR